VLGRPLQLLRGTPAEAVIDEMVLMGFTRADAIEAMTHSVRPPTAQNCIVWSYI